MTTPSFFNADTVNSSEGDVETGSRKLKFGFGREVPLCRQSERAECGLACIAMLAGYYGNELDLANLRRSHAVSQKGLSAKHLIDICANLGLACRALKVEIEELDQLALPAILHWNMNHFVVLVRRRKGKFLIHDPAKGRVLLSVEAVADAFTGIGIEVQPSKEFKPGPRPQRLNPFSLLGRLDGHKSTIFYLLLLGLMLEVLALASPLANQFAIDQAIVSLDVDLMTALALGMGLLLIAQLALNAYRSWVVTYMTTRVGLHLTTSVFRHLLSLNTEYFQKRQVGDIVTRFDSVVFIQRILTTGMVESVLDGILVLGTFAMMCLYSPLFALISLVACACYSALRYMLFKALYQHSDTQLACAARRESAFLETIRAIRSIKLFGRQHDRLGYWLNAAIDEQNANLHVTRHRLLFKTLGSLLFGVDSIVFLFLAARAIMAGEFSVGMLFTMTAYKGQFSSRVISLVDRIFEFRLLNVHVRRIGEIVNEPPEQRHPAAPLPKDLTADIRIRNLAFRHSRTDPFIFKNLNLAIDAGESVSIIGPSGCGKSTLIKLIAGLMNPVEGDIRIGGMPLTQVRDQLLGNFVSVVMQEDQLLSGSVMENISFFDAELDFDRVVECARLAGIHDEILDMPMGYQTLLGDMGSVLSGGEKQRLLLARALYPGPKILILDEATSNIDIFREREINARLRGLKITRIVVAHRLETAMATDRQIKFGELVGRKMRVQA